MTVLESLVFIHIVVIVHSPFVKIFTEFLNFVIYFMAKEFRTLKKKKMLAKNR